MAVDTINIVVIGAISPHDVEHIRNELQQIFAYEFKVLAHIPMPKKCYMKERGQYDAACVLERVLEFSGFRVVGLVSEDIAYPEFNFLLGLAAQSQRGALVSLYRLKNSSKSIYFERVKKELMHELGHTFGLKHCKNKCVMQFSNTVFDVDTKPPQFCEDCKSKIKEHLR